MDNCELPMIADLLIAELSKWKAVAPVQDMTLENDQLDFMDAVSMKLWNCKWETVDETDGLGHGYWGYWYDRFVDVGIFEDIRTDPVWHLRRMPGPLSDERTYMRRCPPPGRLSPKDAKLLNFVLEDSAGRSKWRFWTITSAAPSSNYITVSPHTKTSHAFGIYKGKYRFGHIHDDEWHVHLPFTSFPINPVRKRHIQAAIMSEAQKEEEEAKHAKATVEDAEDDETIGQSKKKSKKEKMKAAVTGGSKKEKTADDFNQEQLQELLRSNPGLMRELQGEGGDKASEASMMDQMRKLNLSELLTGLVSTLY